MENVTPIPATNGRSNSDELSDCFQEATALADVLWSIDTGDLGRESGSRLGLMLLTRISRAEELAGELLAASRSAS